MIKQIGECGALIERGRERPGWSTNTKPHHLNCAAVRQKVYVYISSAANRKGRCVRRHNVEKISTLLPVVPGDDVALGVRLHSGAMLSV
eukprot:1588173-Pleurochrysis_carterae.AAC.1